MQFLEDVKPLDVLALSAVEGLLFTGNKGSLQKVLSHPKLRDGITDEWTSLVAVTIMLIIAQGYWMHC